MEAQVPTLDALALSEPTNLHGPVISADGVNGYAQMPYLPDLLKWVHFGTEGDHPKSWGLMGGGVGPGLGAVVLFVPIIDGTAFPPNERTPNRKQEISWYLADGYQPSPISEWDANCIHMRIQHFSIRTMDRTSTVVHSSVQMTNRSDTTLEMKLAVNSSPKLMVPLSIQPTESSNFDMMFSVAIESGKTIEIEFVAHAAGRSLDFEQLANQGRFSQEYARLCKENDERIAQLAHPVTLPNQGVANMYKAIQIQLWGLITDTPNGDREIRAGAPNPGRLESYDRTFPHDVPNYVDQFIREGDYELGLAILESSYYQVLNSSDISDWGNLNYMDTIGKWILPYAQYLQNTGNTDYFTDEVMDILHRWAKNLHDCREWDDEEHRGLIRKGEDFENWAEDGDFLLCDNWAALHGLQAYTYICETMGQLDRATWAQKEMESINDAVNRCLDSMMKRRGTDYYWGAFDDVSFKRYTRGSFYAWVPYAGALSTFPWGARLKGCHLGGTWKDYFDASITWSLSERDRRVIPEGSWGAWWGHVTYGSTYNAAAGVQCLFSDEHRTQSLGNVEFLYENQCAPNQWSEAFEFKGEGQWPGMYLPQESYGNYESWGTSFTKQSTLQSCVSVTVDGTVIIGRGIPDRWLKPGDVIEWANVNINNGKIVNFRITSAGTEIQLELWGDTPEGDVLFNLPAFTNNIVSATAGSIDQQAGLVRLEPGENNTTVLLQNAISIEK
ncbi:hypothetical protein G7Y41_09690 [Schaalia sp. ZJ405]|uniref:hypothetical protein n=1 Tax=Schaalia sp. ZJ405 TaxID=2709403 RepID=UPI0013EBFEBC|nr:hypothetical protein [Schaalia sp. ZJ405]QPK81273.1 hypothetical protein G7Y41_09690 [Schaalia sp. ZJ405]